MITAASRRRNVMSIVRTVAKEMRKVTDDFEVLVVDDGSKDETGRILDRLTGELPFLRVIHHERLQRAERLLSLPLAGHGLEVGVALEIAQWLGTQPSTATHDR